jgi:hypothetical protein
MKIIVMIFLLILIIEGRSFSQSSYNEFSGSYGVQSSNSIIYNGLLDPFIMLFSLGTITQETKNVKTMGPVILSWKHIPKSRWFFGILMAYLKGSNDEISSLIWPDSQTVSHRSYSVLTLSPEIDFRYIRKEKFTMYSSFAFGITFLSEKSDGPLDKTIHSDGHLSLLGLRYGKKVGVFTELGYGFKGLLNFGINLRL